MNLREAVEEVIESAMIDGWHSMEPETSLWKHNVEQQARAAITAMRDALLGEAAVEAAAKAALGHGRGFGIKTDAEAGEQLWQEIQEDADPFGIRYDHGTPEYNIASARAALTAALAAVAGTDGTETD